MPDDNADPLIFTFLTEVGIIDQLARASLERVLPDGLKFSHFGVLNHFARLGGEQSPAELARAFQVTKGAMTNTVQRLQARGLVDVGPNPHDGRGKRIRITEKGFRVRDEAILAVAPELRQLGGEFSAEEFAAALPFLQRLRVYLDAARDRPDDRAGLPPTPILS